MFANLGAYTIIPDIQSLIHPTKESAVKLSDVPTRLLLHRRSEFAVFLVGYVIIFSLPISISAIALRNCRVRQIRSGSHEATQRRNAIIVPLT